MMMKIIIYWCVGISFGFTFLEAASPTHSDFQLNQIREKINHFQNGSLMVHAQWSMCLINATRGETLIEVNAHKSLAPASCLKLVTSAVALCSLGTDFKFETRIEYDGQIDENNILTGNLYITGGGDPTLGTGRIDSVLAVTELMQLWVDKIKARGIQRISGHIIADDSHFDQVSLPDTWCWIDLGNYYGAAASGLCINENLYKLYFKPGKLKGQKTFILRTEPVVHGLNFMNAVTTGSPGSGDNAYIFGAPNLWTCYLRGTVPAGKHEFSIKGSLPNPAKVCARWLYETLKTNSIHIDGQVYSIGEMRQGVEIQRPRTVICKIKSPQLKDIVFWLNKRSINLYAEQILKQLGKQLKDEGSWAAGIQVIEVFFQQHQIPCEGLNLHDGSGLSRFNGITTWQLVKLLQIMTHKHCFEAFYNSLPIVGNPNDPGTVASWGLGTAAAHNARIKTGYIEGVRSHAGYVKNRRGELLCLAMIAYNYSGSSKQVDKFHEALVISLANLR